MIKILTNFNLYQLSAQLSKTAPVMRQETASGKDKYRKFHKDGPELYITKLLMVNGPLSSKEIWRMYQRSLLDCKKKAIEADF